MALFAHPGDAGGNSGEVPGFELQNACFLHPTDVEIPQHGRSFDAVMVLHRTGDQTDLVKLRVHGVDLQNRVIFCEDAVHRFPVRIDFNANFVHQQSHVLWHAHAQRLTVMRHHGRHYAKRHKYDSEAFVMDRCEMFVQSIAAPVPILSLFLANYRHDRKDFYDASFQMLVERDVPDPRLEHAVDPRILKDVVDMMLRNPVYKKMVEEQIILDLQQKAALKPQHPPERPNGQPPLDADGDQPSLEQSPPLGQQPPSEEPKQPPPPEDPKQPPPSEEPKQPPPSEDPKQPPPSGEPKQPPPKQPSPKQPSPKQPSPVTGEQPPKQSGNVARSREEERRPREEERHRLREEERHRLRGEERRRPREEERRRPREDDNQTQGHKRQRCGFIELPKGLDRRYTSVYLSSYRLRVTRGPQQMCGFTDCLLGKFCPLKHSGKYDSPQTGVDRKRASKLA